jgi:hypothetical protein
MLSQGPDKAPAQVLDIRPLKIPLGENIEDQVPSNQIFYP